MALDDERLAGDIEPDAAVLLDPAGVEAYRRRRTAKGALMDDLALDEQRTRANDPSPGI